LNDSEKRVIEEEGEDNSNSSSELCVFLPPVKSKQPALFKKKEKELRQLSEGKHAAKFTTTREEEEEKIRGFFLGGDHDGGGIREVIRVCAPIIASIYD